MNIVLSVTESAQLESFHESGADIAEIRLDLISDHSKITEFCKNSDMPIILTLRSSEEGGSFSGGTEEWYSIIQPYISIVDYVDLEQRFRVYAADIKKQGPKIIASCHINSMPSEQKLKELYSELSEFGDIPKIAVKPDNEKDLLKFCEFTLTAQKPVVTSIMGEGFRWGRVFLPLMGSAFSYCHAGTPAAAGQYSVTEMQELVRLLIVPNKRF